MLLVSIFSKNSINRNKLKTFLLENLNILQSQKFNLLYSDIHVLTRLWC